MTFETFDPSKHQFLVEGRQKCAVEAPKRPMRVYFKRGSTGSGVIYLYMSKAASARACPEAEKAFGWISVPIGSRIHLPQKEGWCDWFADNANLHVSLAAAGVRDGHVMFFPGALNEQYASRTYADSVAHSYFVAKTHSFGGIYGVDHSTANKLDRGGLEELRDAMRWRYTMWLDGEHVV